MKIYKVGGYVRDTLLGIESKDVDYVVVDSTPEEMQALGYEQVGADFPVFLHPETQDEYALARIERKTGLGYNGFSVEFKNVTLAEDLFRRDLTINSMAFDENNILIDPYNGLEDLKSKTLRHVSEHFKEDPVRILRTARFAARYDFKIAPETMSFMKEMVDNKEFDNLTKERVWKEFEKAFNETHLNNFFIILKEIGALERLPGFSNDLSIDYLDVIKDKDNNNFLNSLFIFSQLTTNLEAWAIPTNLKKEISQFKEWKDNDKFYSFMTPEEQLSFIQKNKAIHDFEKAKELFDAIQQYVVFENPDFSYDYENELATFTQHVESLKDIPYEDIVKNAPKGTKVNELIKDTQLNALNKPKGLKL